MATPRFFNIRKDADAERFGLSTTQPTRNSDGVPARDFMLTRRIPDRFGNGPRFIVLHIQEGVTMGSLEHWTAGRDAEGDPITASSTVMIQRDGSILRVIPEQHGPWTNGDVNNPTPQSLPLRNLGPDPNVWSLTIEAEGQPGDDMPAAEVTSIVRQCRSWMKKYGIPVQNVLPHSSINNVTRSQCPGSYYGRVIRRLDRGHHEELVRQGVLHGGDDTVAPTPPPPFDGQPKTVGGVVYRPFRRRVTSTGVNRRKRAAPDAPRTGDLIPAGTLIDVLYWVSGRAVEGNDVWLVGESGSFIWSGGVEEAVP